MRLERLEISGFKSFSDRSELSFDQGVTAIVGPNGCGKSNVADAITWVLGEQSAKSLRGDKMEDVIFNGSDARKPGAADPPLADGASLHLHATDDGLGAAGEWFVRGVDGGVVWEHGHQKGDVAVRGAAADLLLALLRRRPSDSVETIGDADVWERWLATTGF